MMRSAVACADCHGSDARGRIIQVMLGQAEAPDIRWSTLTAPTKSPGDKALDPDSFFLAVTEGLDPTGATLKTFMPHWQPLNVSRFQPAVCAQFSTGDDSSTNPARW